MNTQPITKKIRNLPCDPGGLTGVNQGCYQLGYHDALDSAADIAAPLEASHGELLAALHARDLSSKFDDPWRTDHDSVYAEMQKLGFESKGHEQELPYEFADRLAAAAIANAEKLNSTKQ